ncbi:replication factor C large subunit [Nanoarchaeota archaeon NZ13-N]|nr:MAG: replication factor C large subunit [Nanoarchaeota archaeon NZ13-N]
MLWVRKYAPKNSYEIINQSDAIKKIKDFIINYRKYEKKALLLWGPPGVGKTCSVYAIAREFGYEVVELNASDVRAARNIHEKLDEAIKGKPFFHKGRIIFIDEVDGLAGKYDRGGASAIVNIIKESIWPVILAANDPWDPNLRKIREVCELVKFKELSNTEIFKALKKIASAEKLEVDDKVLWNLAERSQGDLRSAINDLQTLSGLKRRILIQDLAILGYREREIEIFKALGAMFKASTLSAAKNVFNNVDMDPEEIEGWIEENIANKYEDIRDIFEAYDWMSKARIFYGRIYVRQYWDLLKYYTAIMYGGVALAKSKQYEKFTKFRMPSYVRRLSRSKDIRERLENLLGDLSRKVHSSKKRVREVYINIVYGLIDKHPEVAKSYLRNLGLKEEEIDFIIQNLKSL